MPTQSNRAFTAASADRLSAAVTRGPGIAHRATAPGASSSSPSSQAAKETSLSKWRRGPEQALTVDAHCLAIELARAGEPVNVLAKRYPHAMNAIANAWNDPSLTLQVIDDLLTDRRGRRRGLPADALAEVLSMSIRCELRLAKKP